MSGKRNTFKTIVLLLSLALLTISCGGNEKKKPKGDSVAEKAYKRGNAYYKRGKKDLALKEYKQALSFDEKHVKTLYNIGSLYNEKGNYAEALSAYEKFLEYSDEESFASKRKATLKEIDELKKKVK